MVILTLIYICLMTIILNLVIFLLVRSYRYSPMGLVFEDLHFDFYLGKPDKSGIKEITETHTVKAIWNGNLTLQEREQRYSGKDVTAEIKILFNKRIPKPDPKNCLITRNGKLYRIVNQPDNIPSKMAFYVLGLEETKDSSP